MSKTKKDETALELDDILSEPITNSQKLAAFLQRKAAEAQKPKNDLVFGNFSFELDFDVPVIQKPQSEAANETPALDVAHSPPNVASHENLPPHSGRNSPSPTRRRPPRRSGTGGHVPGSDKLRRHAIRRRSQSCGRRQLLQDFDDAANLTRSSSSPFPFVPEISSTPNCNEKILENQPESRPPSQPQPASDPQPINSLASNAFAAEIAEIFEQRFALFENSMMQMDHKGDAPSPRPVSRPLTSSESHRTYTIEKRPTPTQLLPSPSSPNISQSKKPVVRVRRFGTSLSPGTPNILHQCERVSAPVEECYVPETQPQQSQQLAEIVHNLSRNSSVVVIPLGGAFSPKPDAVRPLSQPHSPVASRAGARAAPTVTDGTPESSSPTVSAATHKSLKSKTVSRHRTPQIVEDLDAILTEDESDEQPSGCALNLAPTGGNTSRQSRIRKRNIRKPSDDQESSMKLLNLHRSNKSSKSKSKGATAPRLNKAPSAPINGEQFAKELERMSNYEILDLRKRNSLGRVYPLNGNKKHSAEQQEVLEQNIQWELIRRNLPTETETEALPSSVSVQREELDYWEEATDMPPPAPVGFKDNSQKESRGPSKERRQRPSRSRRREVPMTAELINYMALSKTMEIRRKSSRNYCKRSLYTKGDSEVEDVDSVSPEKQPRFSMTCLEPTPGGARSMESHDVGEEEIAIVPPPPRSLRYSQCLRDVRHSSKSDFDEVMATPQDLDDGDNPRSQSNGQKNILDEMVPPPSEYNDNTEEDGVDVQGKSSFSMSSDAQPRLSKSSIRHSRKKQISPLPLEERLEFDDQSDRISNANGRRSKRSPEKSEAEEIHETVVPRMSKNRSRRLSRMATQEEDIVEPPGNTMDNDATTDQRSAHREVLPINTVVSSLLDSTAVTDDQPSTSRAALEALARRTNEPESEARAVVEEVAVVFKKPLARAPRAKSKAKRELDNLRISIVHDEVDVDFNESSIRRSRRGQVPLKNTWCHTSDPRQFDFFRNSMDINEKTNIFKPSKKSNRSRVTKVSLLNRPPLCSSTPRLSEEHLHAVIEDFEPQEPSECSSLGVAPLRWKDNDTNAVNATEPESVAAAFMPPPAPVPKKRGRKKKKQAPQQTVTERETELECDPDPVAPIPPTPSPSVSDVHQAASMQFMNWLRGYSSNQPTLSMEDSSGNRIGKSVSTVGELVFTNLDDIEYAFYDTKDKATVGYMRFQPSQKREKKRAKGFSLKFVVLFGRFGIDCSVPDVEEDDHCTLNIGDMVEIEKGTRYSIQNLLNEVSVLMVIRN